MTKLEFLTALRANLWRIPAEDAQRSVDYYSEMIDDRMDEGLTEEAAVAAIGDPAQIAAAITEEASPSPAPPQAPAKRKGLRVWEIILLILGAPLWLPLLIAAAAIVLSVLLVLWVAVGVLFCGALSMGASGIGILFGMVPVLITGRIPEAVVLLGSSLICAGLCILLVMGGNLALKGMAWLTKKTFGSIGKLFRRKERAA